MLKLPHSILPFIFFLLFLTTKSDQHNNKHPQAQPSQNEEQNMKCSKTESYVYQYCTVCWTYSELLEEQSLQNCSGYFEEKLYDMKPYQCYENCCRGENVQMPYILNTFYFFIMLGFSVAFCLCFCICTCYRRIALQRAQNQRTAAVHNVQNQYAVPIIYNNNQQMVYHENSQAVLDQNNFSHHQFPKRLETDEKAEADLCCICLEDNVNTLTSCNHYFHLECLKAWFKKKNTCPLCSSQGVYLVNFYCLQCHNQIQLINMRQIWRRAYKLQCPHCRN